MKYYEYQTLLSIEISKFTEVKLCKHQTWIHRRGPGGAEALGDWGLGAGGEGRGPGGASIKNSIGIRDTIEKNWNFSVDVICHNLAKNGKIWRWSGRLEHPNIRHLLTSYNKVFKHPMFNNVLVIVVDIYVQTAQFTVHMLGRRKKK